MSLRNGVFPPVNALIASLPRRDRDDVTSLCTIADLTFGESICEPGDAIRHVYFPTVGYISMITPKGAAESLEVGMVGNEGAFGVTLMFDVTTSPLQGLVQGAGEAMRMTARQFNAARETSTAFQHALNRYLYVLTSQLAQTAACNRFHSLDTRLARWLLLSQDRAHGDTFRMTHEFLAYMLGVRRAGVTEAAGRLQKDGLIRYVRGELTILDRPGLEGVSCPCYATQLATYARYVPKPRTQAAVGPGRKVFAR